MNTLRAVLAVARFQLARLRTPPRLALAPVVSQVSVLLPPPVSAPEAGGFLLFNWPAV